MSVIGTRRIMETTSPETANHYLRFGWKLLNQYTVPATDDTPEKIRYVLASVTGLEDTRRLLELFSIDAVNAHLALGWRLIEKFITTEDDAERRRETIHFVLAWQRDEEPPEPGPQTPQLQTKRLAEINPCDLAAGDEIAVEP